MKLNTISLTTLFTCFIGTFAQAHELHIPAQNLQNIRQNACNHHQYAKPTVVNCGDVITQSIRIANDLNCPDTTGFALSLQGDNVTIDGNGRTIYAPNALAGIYVQGKNDTVQNLKATGASQGYGLFAYDSPGLKVSRNDFSSNSVGIVLYAENTTMNNLVIVGNRADNNSNFGVRTGQDGNGSIVDPIITANSFQNSGYFAMILQATHDTLGDYEQNDLSNSQNGIDLKDGVFSLHDMDLSRFGIQKMAIFADSAASVQISNVDVSTHLTPNSNQENIGVDFYRVQSFDVRGLVCNNNDVGLKLETENGVSCTGRVIGSYFYNNNFAGIMITSYDGTPYGVLDLSTSANWFHETSSSIYNIFTSSGTVWSQPAAPTSPSCGRH